MARTAARAAANGGAAAAAGDWLEPFGLDGSKKLSDLFTDEKVPRRKRQLVPVVDTAGTCCSWLALGHRGSRL